jgi:hypothetical protein
VLFWRRDEENEDSATFEVAANSDGRGEYEDADANEP